MANGKLQIWANAVKERDGKCVACGKKEDLHAHHIKPKASHPELMLDIDNGKTLCYACHKLEHEKNRPTRIRSNRPQRRTMEKKIKELEIKIKELEIKIKEFESKIKDLEIKNKKFLKLTDQCKKGYCKSGFMLARINSPFWKSNAQ